MNFVGSSLSVRTGTAFRVDPLVHSTGFSCQEMMIQMMGWVPMTATQDLYQVGITAINLTKRTVLLSASKASAISNQVHFNETSLPVRFFTFYQVMGPHFSSLQQWSQTPLLTPISRFLFFLLSTIAPQRSTIVGCNHGSTARIAEATNVSQWFQTQHL